MIPVIELKPYDVAIVGAGFVGSELARRLCVDYDVVALDIKPEPSVLTEMNIEYRMCDIRRYDEVKSKLGKPRVVAHTAIIQIPAINETRKQGYDSNVTGTHNVCKAVEEEPETRGLILTGSWHVFGERGYTGFIDDSYGYRPDKVEERARLYVISKMVQEGIVRFYDGFAEGKIYGIIRFGTVLGENMPEKTAANLFITNGLKGLPITPYKHTMYRPMLYVSIDDVCKAFHSYVDKIISDEIGKGPSSNHIFNLFHPEPLTVLELAQTVREAIVTCTKGKVLPEIKEVDQGLPALFTPEDKRALHVDLSDALRFFDIKELKSPKEVVFDIVRKRCRR